MGNSAGWNSRYDEKGQVVNETALDKQGHTVFMLTYAAAQAEAFKKVGSVRNTRLAFVVAADGSAISSSDIRYDPQGYVSEITYLSGRRDADDISRVCHRADEYEYGNCPAAVSGADRRPHPGKRRFRQQELYAGCAR